jgi:DNA-binding transcriptional MocR family regulator
VIQLVLDRLDDPSARGLAGAVSRAIGDGALVPGAKLPPIRRVAAELGLSPTTVSAAWQLLARSGAIRSDGRRGTVVATPRATGPSRYRRALRQRASFAPDLSTGVPDPLLLPDVGPALRRLHATRVGSYLDEPVVGELGQLLHDRWPAPAERITIVDGAMDALDHVASSLLRLGDRAVVESPGFPPLLDLLDALGVEAVGVPLDAEGPVPAQLTAALARRPAMVVLQPRAQNPTGVSWSAARAADLASVLAPAAGVTIVEDDSAGDIASTPLHSLGQWLPDRTVHIRSFAKSHGPDLRLAALGGPATIIDPIVERRLLGQGWSSRLLQLLLLDLLTDPASVAAVAAAREEYARRRALLARALRRAGVDINGGVNGSAGNRSASNRSASNGGARGGHVSGGPVSGGDGINLWLPVADEQAALISLASEGIGAAGGAAFHPESGPAPTPHLRLTVGLVPSGHGELAGRLARAAQAGAWGAPR